MKLKVEIDEVSRRRTALILSVGGWCTAFVLVVLDTAGILPRTSVGVVIVFIIGVAIAASQARSRMLLADTIVKTFQAGTDAVRMQRSEK